MPLRPIEERDLEIVRTLRNRNRRWFFDDHELSMEDQRRWFLDLQHKPKRFYVIEEQGEVVGTISITTTASGKEVGNLIIDERHRGRGLMRRAIEELTAEPGRYFCEVKVDNEASQRVFRQVGFSATYVCLERIVKAT